MITKSLEASCVLRKAYNRLKKFILSYDFHGEQEEILFFKEIKSRLCFSLIYYRKLHNIEMDRPIGIEKQREYFNDLLDGINRFNSKRLDFMHYYRSGSSHMDTLYFLRGKADAEQYMETFSYKFDEEFTTNCELRFYPMLCFLII